MKSTHIFFALALSLTACPPPSNPSEPGAKPSGVNPEACGELPKNDVGRKLVAFLNAAVRLEQESNELQTQTRKLCLDMGKAMGMKLSGDTKSICEKVSVQLESNIKTSLKPEAKLVVKHKPAVCKVNMDAAIKAQAQCEAKAEADIRMTCKGTCQGTCSGQCSGTCSAKNADGSCAGQCQGTCQGSCSGACEGSAKASGSAECEAEAEVRANLEAKCTPPELEIAFDATLVTNQKKLTQTTNAIKIGLPGLLALSAKAGGPVLTATLTFAKTATELANSIGSFGAALGAASVCAASQVVAAATVAANVQVSISVSVEASASVGGACNATPN